jgi:hypothetical protein
MKTLRVYHLGKRRIVFVLAYASFIASVSPAILDILFSHKYTGTGSAWLVFSLLFLFFSIWAFLWALKSKLLVSSQGIECQDFESFVSIKTDWQNIAAFHKDRFSFYLLLKTPGQPTTKFAGWLFSHSLINPRVVNLSGFIDHWTEQELIEDFRLYIPELF